MSSKIQLLKRVMPWNKKSAFQSNEISRASCKNDLEEEDKDDVNIGLKCRMAESGQLLVLRRVRSQATERT